MAVQRAADLVCTMRFAGYRLQRGAGLVRVPVTFRVCTTRNAGELKAKLKHNIVIICSVSSIDDVEAWSSPRLGV
jgi:hypothetical protein